MKSQKHNQGELKELRVDIEQDVVESFEKMAQRTGISLADLVATALKRFRASHTDYIGQAAKTD